MDDLEIFIPIKGLDGYMVSSHYRILSFKSDKPKFLKRAKGFSNYCYQTSINGKKQLLNANHLWYINSHN